MKDANSSAKKNEHVGFVTVGQAGGNVGKELMKRGYEVLFLNSSLQDLETLGDITHFYHIKSGEGSAGDRNKVMELAETDIDNIIAEINAKILCEHVFVIFSAGGGTGSGLSPALIHIIATQTSKKVGACVILPDSNEVARVLLNAYECVYELSEIKEMGACFFIDNNSLPNRHDINKIFATTFDSFIQAAKHHSIDGNIDLEEVKTLLSTPGAAVLGATRKYTCTEPKDGRQSPVTPERISASLTQALRKGIFAPIENDRLLTRMGISTADDLSIEVLRQEFGEWDIFQGRNPDQNVVILTGLSFPHERLTEIKETAEKKLAEREEKKQAPKRLLEPPSFRKEAGTPEGEAAESKDKKAILSRYLKRGRQP